MGERYRCRHSIWRWTVDAYSLLERHKREKVLSDRDEHLRIDLLADFRRCFDSRTEYIKRPIKMTRNGGIYLSGHELYEALLVID